MRNLSRFLLQGLALVILLALITIGTRLALFPADAEGAFRPVAGATGSPLPPTLTVAPTGATVPATGPGSSPTVTPTPTSTPPPTPSPSPTATPVASPTPLPTPRPVPAVSLPDDVINIVLLGVDQEGPDMQWWRTDVIVVASVNPEGPSVSLLSIPRDLSVWIPDYGFDRINTVDYRGEAIDYPGGGPALVKATIEHNLGVPIHYYARVDFQGFVRIVDTLGGLDVPVECELHDTFPNPADPEQGIDVDFLPGVQHLDGWHSLWYVRSRWSTHDFDRNRRQHQVLRALYRQALTLDIIPRIPELWGALQETARTDLGLDEMIRLGLVGSQLEWTNVKSRFIAPPYVAPSTGPNGAYILLPVPGVLDTLVAEALQPAAAGRAEQPSFRVEVLDGTGKPGLSAVAVERLRWEGFEVVGTGPAEQVYPYTTIVDHTTTPKGSPLWLLTRLYNRNEGDVVRQPTEGSPVHFRVILGADYNSCIPTNALQYVPTPTPTPTATP